jgi:hypothetical protein
VAVLVRRVDPILHAGQELICSVDRRLIADVPSLHPRREMTVNLIRG